MGKGKSVLGLSVGVPGLSVLCAGQTGGPQREGSGPEAGRAARAAFDKFRALEGAWRGESTKGWKEDVTFKTIAGGSAVMETSFDAHPNETMATMIRPRMSASPLRRLDRRAKNRPRLTVARGPLAPALLGDAGPTSLVSAFDSGHREFSEASGLTLAARVVSQWGGGARRGSVAAARDQACGEAASGRSRSPVRRRRRSRAAA